MNEFKDVTITGLVGTKKYRIGLVTAQAASWMVLQIETGKFSQADVFRQVQAGLFGACTYYQPIEGQADVSVPLFENGRWLLAGIERDVLTVDELFEEAMEFNLFPTLKRHDEKRKMKQAEAEVKAAAERAALLVTPQPGSPQT